MNRHIAYLKVVLRHKWFVFLACRRLGVPLWIALVHDWRKFLPRQWFPYARNFYEPDGTKRPGNRADSGDKSFQLAWLDHQRARHHWQAWCVIEDAENGAAVLTLLEIPEVYLRERLADWMGAGLAYDSYKPHEWWTSHRRQICMNEKSKKLLAEILEYEVPRKFVGGGK